MEKVEAMRAAQAAADAPKEEQKEEEPVVDLSLIHISLVFCIL